MKFDINMQQETIRNIEKMLEIQFLNVTALADGTFTVNTKAANFYNTIQGYVDVFEGKGAFAPKKN